MKIHFVCTGNAYRSRLAEAYLSSKQIPNIQVSSSGTRREEYKSVNGPISWYSMRIMRNKHLIPFMSWNSTQTSKELLSQADLIIFFTEDNYEYAKKHFDFNGIKYQIWNIPDLVQFKDDEIDLDNEIGRMKATAEAFEKIEEEVNILIENLKQ